MNNLFTGLNGGKEHSIQLKSVNKWYHENNKLVVSTNGYLYYFDECEQPRFLKEFDAYENPIKEGKYMTKLKEYIDSHADTFFTMAFIIIIDHFVLQGALRQKIQSFCERMFLIHLQKYF